jgi:transcriptional regulator with XRE-family HTH domain
MKAKSFDELYKEARDKDAYRVADAIYSFTEELNRIAQLEGVSRAELARRLGTSAAYVTKVFRGDANFTVESMVRLARAVGARIHIHFAPDPPTTNIQDLEKASGKEAPLSHGARKLSRRRKQGVPGKGTPRWTGGFRM